MIRVFFPESLLIHTSTVLPLIPIAKTVNLVKKRLCKQEIPVKVNKYCHALNRT